MFSAGIDSMVPAFAREGIWLFVFLFVVVFFRAQATYWLARGAASGAVLATGRQGFLGAMARWFDGPVPRKGAAMLDKWGIIAIPLCFLTVGIQTAINAMMRARPAQPQGEPAIARIAAAKTASVPRPYSNAQRTQPGIIAIV